MTELKFKKLLNHEDILAFHRKLIELNNLIDRNEALLAEPILVKRLRRIRDARTATRSSSKLGFTL